MPASICALSTRSSSFAMISPFLTVIVEVGVELDDAARDLRADLTVVRADSVPFAVTCAAIVPLPTATVENVIGVAAPGPGLL